MNAGGPKMVCGLISFGVGSHFKSINMFKCTEEEADFIV